MKKLLILRSKAENNRDKVVYSYLDKQFFGKVRIDRKDFSEILIEFSSELVKVRAGQEDIVDYDLVWIRNTGRKFIKMAIALAGCFEFLKVKYFDTSLGKRSIGGDKLINLIRLARAGLPVPHTFFCFRDGLEDSKRLIVKGLGFPCVGKLLDKHWGQGVFVLKNEAEFDRLGQDVKKRGQMMFQEFLPHDGDFRILVLKDKIGSWERMWRSSDTFPLAVGDIKSKEFFPVEKITPEMADLSLRAAKAVSIEVAGVDIMEDKRNGKYFLTEVNRAPAFAIDYPGDPELKAMAKFLKSELNE